MSYHTDSFYPGEGPDPWENQGFYGLDSYCTDDLYGDTYADNTGNLFTDTFSMDDMCYDGNTIYTDTSSMSDLFYDGGTTNVNDSAIVDEASYSTPFNDLVEENFRLRPDLANAYIQSDYVQGQFDTFSNWAQTSPTNFIGMDYDIQNAESGTETWAFRINETLNIIKNVLRRR